MQYKKGAAASYVVDRVRIYANLVFVDFVSVSLLWKGNFPE
jgi:hypothetical protein